METVAPIIGGLGVLSLIIGCVLLLPIANSQKRRPLAKSILIGGAVAVTVGLILDPRPAADGSPEIVAASAPASASSQAVMRAKVVDAGYYPPVLNLNLDFGANRSAAVITAAGEEMVDLGKQMVADKGMFSRSVEVINFEVLGGTDTSSAAGRKIVHYSVKADTMRALSRAGASGKQMLDAAHEAGSWTPNNDAIVRDYCVSMTPFCQRLGAR